MLLAVEIGRRRPRRLPWTIVSMSLRLTIPRRVALQQSSLPLRQLTPIVQPQPPFVNRIASNGIPTLAPCLTREVQSKEAYDTSGVASFRGRPAQARRPATLREG